MGRKRGDTVSEQAEQKKTGRPAKALGEKLIVVPVRMSEKQKAKYQRMKDGPQRLRDWLEQAKE